MKGEEWKLKIQEGSLNKGSKDILVLYSDHFSYRIVYVPKRTAANCICVRMDERGIAMTAFKYFLLMSKANVASKI
jgi:hypothetical protein